MHSLSLWYLESCRMHSLIVSSQFSVIFVSEVLKLLINLVSQICSLIAWNFSYLLSQLFLEWTESCVTLYSLHTFYLDNNNVTGTMIFFNEGVHSFEIMAFFISSKILMSFGNFHFGKNTWKLLCF